MITPPPRAAGFFRARALATRMARIVHRRGLSLLRNARLRRAGGPRRGRRPVLTPCPGPTPLARYRFRPRLVRKNPGGRAPRPPIPSRPASKHTPPVSAHPIRARQKITHLGYALPAPRYYNGFRFKLGAPSPPSEGRRSGFSYWLCPGPTPQAVPPPAMTFVMYRQGSLPPNIRTR